MVRGFVRKEIGAWVFDFEEISPKSQELFRTAVEVRKNAQAPYSKFYVGVSVLSASGKIYSGCNVERASWTQTTHAEQNATDSMVAAEGPVKILTLALVAAPKNEKIIIGLNCDEQKDYRVEDIPVPCGHCLQIIWENCFGDDKVTLMALLACGRVAITDIGYALPMRFGPMDLGVDYSKIREGI